MKRLVIISCSIVAVVAGVWTYVWWQSPAETKETTAASQETQGVLGSNTVLASWSTQYFTTRYPNNLRVITSNEVAHGLTLGQYLLGTASLREADQLAVTVGTLDGMRLEELPAVKLRQQRSDAYQATAVSFAPQGAMVFTAKSGYEMAVFWQQGTRYAAVVASGSAARQAELAQSIQSVVQNWQWQP